VVVDGGKGPRTETALSAEAGPTLSDEPGQARPGVILTPDQRVRVFISSTLEELAPERAAARRAIQRLHLVPVYFESGARPHPPRSMYRAYLEQSQVFVGIYWQRYGWVAPGMDISGLEDEYRLAAGKPMLLYLKRPAPGQEPRLAAMIDAIRAGGTASYRTFATARELERLLADDLAVLLSESFAGAAAAAGSPPVVADEPAGEDLSAARTLSFLFTDIEDSAAMFRRLGGASTGVLADHHRLIHEALAAHGGRRMDTQGDTFSAVFGTARACTAAAIAIQQAMAMHSWPGGGRLRVRIGIHAGEAEETGTGLVGMEVYRGARIAAVAHGGQILVSAAAAALLEDSLPGGASLHDLGMHRLKDLSRPEQIFQLDAPGLPAAFPPLQSLDNPRLPNNLPVQASSFIGRDTELAAVSRLIAASRLVTLTGVGGVGKTRLALQIASEMLDGSGDGVWLAELASFTDPDLVAPTVAAAVGVEEAADRPVLDTLIESLRARELLLVLDNCEHLVSACTRLADALLRTCSKVHLLATSREPLGVAGEHLYRVPSLGLPTADQLAEGQEALRTCEAVRLFVDRATAHQPTFRLDENTGAAVVSICRQLDGIPLAIELAAARLRSLAITDIEHRLDDRFRLLTGGYQSALPRQQTLRALVDWSYDLLTETERSVLRRLSVFAGTFDLAAAENVAAARDIEAGDVLDIVASLLDKSLLQLELGSPSVRYRLLDTVRRYAAQRLAEGIPGDEEATRDRHAAAFLRLAETAAQHFDKADEPAWRDRLEADNANLGASFQRLAGQADRGDDLLRLAETLYRFSITRGAIQEHLGLLRVALDHPSAQKPTAARAQAMLATSSALVRAGGGRREARELQHASLEIARRLGEPALTVRILANLSGSIVMTDNSPAAVAEASELAEEAVTLSRSVGSPDQVAGALRARSAVHSFAERYDEACRDGLEAAGLFRATGNGKGLSRVLNNLGCDEIALGRLDDAQRHLEEALPYSAEGSDTSNSSFVLGNLALVYLLRGDPAAAREPALEALRSIQTDEKSVLRSSTLYLALYHSAVGEPRTAAVLHGAVDGMGVPPEPLDRQMREEDRQHLTTLLGREAFESRLGEGRSLETAEQVLAHLAAASPAHPQTPSEPPGLAQLSARERQLVVLVAQGLTDAQIAAQLYISVRTVRSHLDRIQNKSGCRRRADLTRLALQAGLV
jgi:predicted ATPase/class 3 adenylate cyclase/DNA-binding CsgD family transcriptional regulator